ncbi:MAG: hypothetical protein ACRC33_07340 [Gemmataceae bacterium]
MADGIGLTADQRKEIDTHSRRASELTAVLRAEFVRRATADPEVERVRERLAESGRARMEAVLTPAQQARLNEMLGRPYAGPFPPARLSARGE